MPTPIEDDQTALFNKGKEQLRRILECIAPDLDPAQRAHAESQIEKFGTFTKDDPGEDDENSVTG